MVTKREELEQYRERVSQEVRLRGDRLKEIEGSLASIEYRISATGAATALKSGDTVRLLTRASYQSKLRRERDELERKKREALEDLKRAEERLEDVLREIEDLESSTTDDRGDE